MKLTLVFAIACILISCSTQPETASVKTLHHTLMTADSIDVWLSQWRTAFELGSDKPGISESIYGNAVIIHNDSLFFLSSLRGYYDKAKIDSKSNKTFAQDNIKKSIEIYEDRMFIQFDDYYKVWTYEHDTTKYTLVTSYKRERAASKEVLNVINNGKIEPDVWKDKFLGLDVSNWVKLESSHTYKIK